LALSRIADGVVQSPPAEMTTEYGALEILRIPPVQGGGVGENLGYDGSPGFGVIAELHLDDDGAAGRFYRQNINVTAAELHLAAEHHDSGCSAEREEIWSCSDEFLQSLLVRKSCGPENLPAVGALRPACGHGQTVRQPAAALPDGG
jgi:hypothetical protein